MVVASPKEPVIDISDSSKNKRKSAEDVEPSSPKKRKVAQKSRTAATKLKHTDNFDDYVDNMDLDTSDDVSFQNYTPFFLYCIFFSKPPSQVKPNCSVLFTYCLPFCLAASREESSFDCS